MEKQGLLGFTALMLAALAVLIGLGVWQLQRLEWKERLLARIETRTKSDPITLDQAIDMARSGRDPSYYRVRVEGRFHHAKERYYYTVSDGTVGWDIITPLETAAGDMVMIDRGFVPDELKDPASRPLGQMENVVAVTGIVRAPEKRSLFTPDNQPAANRWFWRDLQAMARSAFPAGIIQVAPFFVEAEKTSVPGGWPEGGQTRLEIPNNHLQYAITWFLLAACLVVIYGVYVRGVYRRTSPAVAGNRADR
jgi:surfeit locus 1 family protein